MVLSPLGDSYILRAYNKKYTIEYRTIKSHGLNYLLSDLNLKIKQEVTINKNCAGVKILKAYLDDPRSFRRKYKNVRVL